MALIQQKSTTASTQISVTLTSAVTIGSKIVVVLCMKDIAAPTMQGSGWQYHGTVTGHRSGDGSPFDGLRIASYTASATTATFSRQVSGAGHFTIFEVADATNLHSTLSLSEQTSASPYDLGNFASVPATSFVVMGLSWGGSGSPALSASGWTETFDNAIKFVGIYPDHPWIWIGYKAGAGADIDPAITAVGGTLNTWGAMACRFDVPTPSYPVADFSGTPLSGYKPLPVQFTDESTNTPTSWAWDFGDGGTSTEQNPLHTYVETGIFTVSMTATNAGGSDSETKIDYIIVIDPGAILDLTKSVCYNGYCFSGITPDPVQPSAGSVIERLSISRVETVGYDDKRALQDGKDAADVFLGERYVEIDAGLYGSSRGATFDELALLAAAYHPVNAFKADETNLGFLALDGYRPTADITTWPTSTFPNGIPLRLYCRPVAPVDYIFKRDETGGVDGKGMAIKAQSRLWARDPRFYLQTAQSISVTASTQTVTYRGDYESWAIVTFTMTAAGSSVAQIVVAGGSVKINLSTLTSGTYALDYSKRQITNTATGALHTVFDTTFTQDFRTVKEGSTFWISALTGISSITLDYREAFV